MVLARKCPAQRTLPTQKKLAYLGIQCLNHPPYSAERAPSDYHLLPGLKKIENSTIFVRRVGQCCRGVQVGREIFECFSDLQTLDQGAIKCIELRGEYVE